MEETNNHKDNGFLPKDPTRTGHVFEETCVDSGYSWIVLFASFLIHLIIFGEMMCMAIFYAEFVVEFAEYGVVANSWLIATQVALGCLAGKRMTNYIGTSS